MALIGTTPRSSSPGLGHTWARPSQAVIEETKECGLPHHGPGEGEEIQMICGPWKEYLRSCIGHSVCTHSVHGYGPQGMGMLHACERCLSACEKKLLDACRELLPIFPVLCSARPVRDQPKPQLRTMGRRDRQTFFQEGLARAVPPGRAQFLAAIYSPKQTLPGSPCTSITLLLCPIPKGSQERRGDPGS